MGIWKSIIHSSLRLVFLSIAFVCIFSCSRPNIQEYFVKTADRDEDGNFAFTFDLEKTYVYDIDILIVMDCNRKCFNKFENTYINIMWVSPKGKHYEEKVWFSRDNLSQETRLSRLFMLPYRSNLRSFEYGEWSVYMTLDDKIIEDFKIPGVGIRLKTEK